jgi:sulfur relay (sulfurtransferase) DsrC/TusE family protein
MKLVSININLMSFDFSMERYVRKFFIEFLREPFLQMLQNNDRSYGSLYTQEGLPLS